MAVSLAWWHILFNSKQRSQKDVYHQIDYRPESTVLVEGVSGTQALLNYLLDYGTCFASSGAQASLPPTILAPVAFTGATLQSLKVWERVSVFVSLVFPSLVVSACHLICIIYMSIINSWHMNIIGNEITSQF